MKKLMSLLSRRELLRSITQRYRAAGRKDKQRIMDEFVEATGYHRKYAVALLNQNAECPLTTEKKPRHQKRRYSDDVKAALLVIWKAANRLCSKRLVPFLPEFIPVLEKHGHLLLTDEVREKLLQVSPATVDRLLKETRRTSGRGVGTTRSGNLLKHQIPVRTFADWDDLKPGFLEADLVAHCGTSTGGAYLSTLTLTDVATTWTECLALLSHDQNEVMRALKHARRLLPFQLLGIDTDNGCEFINKELLSFCREEKLTFTRSRPYKKNDQCHVEQKNGSVVRRMIGYDRYEGRPACQQLASLYGVLRLYVNFFQPSQKLISKERRGGKVVKKYDQAKTPYQRVLASDSIPEEVKTELWELYQGLDPVTLFRQLEFYQDSLWQYAWRSSNEETKADEVMKQQQEERTVTEFPAGKNKLPAAPRVNSPEPSSRYWRCSGKTTKYHSVKRSWRTRRDPYELVWDKVERELEQNPNLCVKDYFQTLQRDYPGQFNQGQLRTLQRRVKEWRAKRATPYEMVIHPMINSGEEFQTRLEEPSYQNPVAGGQAENPGEAF
jgi:hypothetical protein